MAAPNILSLTTGNLTRDAVSSCSTASGGSSVSSNSAASGYVYQCFVIRVTNKTTSAVTFDCFIRDGSSNDFYLAYGWTCPPSSSVDVITYGWIPLIEGDSLRVKAGTGTALDAVVCYVKKT